AQIGADCASSAADAVAAAIVVDADVAAQSTCDLAFTFAPMMLDRLAALPAPMSWQPTDAEREVMQTALAKFYRAHPEYMMDLPPGWALTAAVAGYALPRMLALPSVQALMGNGGATRRDELHAGVDVGANTEALRDAA